MLAKRGRGVKEASQPGSGFRHAGALTHDLMIPFVLPLYDRGLDGKGVSMDIGHMAPVDLVELAPRYAGRWVALDPESGAVLASGDSAKEALDGAESEGEKMPLVIRVLDDYGQLAPCHV